MTRALRSLLGFAVFILVWQAIVAVTRPPPILRTAIAFSTPRDGRVAVVVCDAHGKTVAADTLDVASDSETVAKLRQWLGSIQPTVAGVPPGTPEITARLEQAKTVVGAGVEVREIPLRETAGDARKDAAVRAAEVQRQTAAQPGWLPDPAEAGAALLAMVRSGEMIRHIVASLFRVAMGFVLATLVGVPFGIALGTFARLSDATNAVIQCMRPISPIAWLPVATLALGGGDLAAVFLIFISAFFPLAVSTAAAVAAVDKKYHRSAANFGVAGLAKARRVVLPAALPAILTALRIALGISWVVVVAAEMLGVESGLGYLVLDARNQLRYDRVVAAMMTIGLIGLGLDYVVRRIEGSELQRRGLVAP